ncbi:MAG: hypothetical protein ABSF53_06500 [Terracidiphilus sp.]|jgi:hypothetical protein
MTKTVRSLNLAFFLALLSAGPAFTQTPESTSEPTAAAPVAYVYVQTTKGVNLYDAATDGKLSLVKGSPFQTSGELIGSNGKYVITLGTHDVYSYVVEPDGAIGKLVSEINTQQYAGAQCGTETVTDGANLGHTGQNVYVVLVNFGWCTAIQTFDIAKSSGDLTFNGQATPGGSADAGLSYPPSILGNDTFAYAPSDFGCCGSPPGWSGFMRQSDGTLEDMICSVSYDSGLTLPYGYVPFLAASDPTNHLAAVVSYNTGESEYGPLQLASYTVDSKGDFSTTSTRKNMPYMEISPTSMNMSPAGNLLAVGGWSSKSSDPAAQGLQVFHFNGADPVTPYTKALTKSQIYQIRWDNNDHLYALGGPGLYVYTITPTSIAEAPGSPYSISIENNQICQQGSYSCPYGLVVVTR